jgi:hypothetical protein
MTQIAPLAYMVERMLAAGMATDVLLTVGDCRIAWVRRRRPSRSSSSTSGTYIACQSRIWSTSLM